MEKVVHGALKITDSVSYYRIFTKMPRKRPDDRFDDLIRHAIDAFVAAGSYRRLQMADVAERMGISKGTLYLYVESKEALFHLVLGQADSDQPFTPPRDLPIPAPPSAALDPRLEERVDVAALHPTLAEAIDHDHVEDVRAELEAIFREVYRVMARYRERTKLIECFVADRPELSERWFGTARGGLMRMLVRYLQKRVDEGVVRSFPDVRVAARVALETCMTWAVHIRWDPSPQQMDEEQAEGIVAQILAGGLLDEGA